MIPSQIVLLRVIGALLDRGLLNYGQIEHYAGNSTTGYYTIKFMLQHGYVRKHNIRMMSKIGHERTRRAFTLTRAGLKYLLKNGGKI